MPRTEDDRRYPYYPAFLDLRRKRVVVVGAGIVATDKVRGLLPCGPDPLIVFAPEASQFIQNAADEGRLTWHRRSYQDGDLADADLCFAATHDRTINAIVAREARRRSIPVLAVDDVPNCDFIAASLVRRGDLIVAISTGGRSPAFARWVRERFDRDIPGYWNGLLDVVATARQRLGPDRARVKPEDWLESIDNELESLVEAEETERALELLLSRLRERAAAGQSKVPAASEHPDHIVSSTVSPVPTGDDGLIPLPLGEGAGEGVFSPLPLGEGEGEGRTPSNHPSLPSGGPKNALTLTLSQRERGEATERVGFVSLVGAGPGDPELLTLRGLRRLQEADAVVYDRLVATEILGFCRADAERFDVGKAPGHHARPQEEINELLVRLGRDGRRVVRLKGGDPFVFGRGGEEVLALRRAGIPCEVVPGVSSAFAVPAAAGIPVTHRGLANAVTVATGHARSGSDSEEHDWGALARTTGTLVFLMAVENLDHIVGSLVEHGRDPAEPAAMIQSGTTADQRTVRAPLGEIVKAVRAARIAAPAVLVVGKTVNLAGEIGESFARVSGPGDGIQAQCQINDHVAIGSAPSP